MKKNYTRMCTLALAMCMSAASWAIDIVDGVYQIGTAQDMQDFATAVIENDGEVDGVLTADIDITDDPAFMIASNDVSYKGTFDGKYHTVTVAWESAGEYISLFRKVGDGVIRNLRVAGTMHAIDKHCAPLVGATVGASIIENVITDVAIESTTDGDGSHSGLIGTVSGGSSPIISNVLVAGSIKGNSNQCGGLVGWSDGAPVFNNVLVISEFEIGAASDKTWGNLTFVRNPGTAKLNNCYYLNPLDNVDPEGLPTFADDLSSGETCFSLNLANPTVAWTQNLGEDEYPIPFPIHKQVYRIGRSHCDGSAYDDVEYSNEQSSTVVDEHDMYNGLCTYCHYVDESYITPAADGFYELASAADLCWFAYMVKAGHGDINGRLTAPVDMDEVEFFPIGSLIVPYSGTFQGNLQPISNVHSMIFGVTSNATIDGVYVESGVVGSYSSVASHTGSIAGTFSGTMTRCYSAASIQAGGEDCGGLVGKIKKDSSIKNCMFAGNLTSGWSAGLIAGSTDGNAADGVVCAISDVILDTRNVTYSNGDAHGILVGWFHTGQAQYADNIWVVEGGELTDLVGYKDDLDALMPKTHFITAEEAASGMAAMGLNRGDIVNPTWFQTIGEDEVPSLLPSRGVVFLTSEDEYTNDMKLFRADVIENGKSYLETVVAYKGDIEAYSEALEAFAAAEEWNPELYTAANSARSDVEKSEKVYTKYMSLGQDVESFIAESDLVGPAAESLISYVEENVEPGDEFVNGSLVYICENMQLTAEQIEKEIEYLNSLKEDALKANYVAGDEITNLIANVKLNESPKFTGWETLQEGSTLTTGTTEVMTVGEFWNATGYVKQTLTGLKNGVYEVRVNAAGRPATNAFNGNDNYFAYLFANDDEVYVQSLTEDMVDDETAVDGVNCHLTGDAVDQQLDIDGVTYYVPYGPVSGSYAFNGGRYENRVLTNVTDGNLTLGIRLPGTGLSNDWIGFGNFRLFYLGATDEAADAMDDGIANYVARANTLINYSGDINAEMSDEINYRSKPNFSEALRTALSENVTASEAAATTEEKLAVCARFTELFHEIDSCKAAYVEYLDFANEIWAAVYRDVEATTDEMQDMEDVYSAVLDKWENGEYSTAEALEMADIKASLYYKRYFENTPAFKNGFYQLASVEDFIWFANTANTASNRVNAELVAPIDLTDADFNSIGSKISPYAGTFRGNLYPITGLSCMLFGVVDGATIDGVVIKGGVVEGNAEIADHTGALAGHAISGTFTRCYSSATVQNGNGDCGGFFGKINQPIVIKDFMFAGNLTSGWSAGLIAGSSNYSNANMKISDIFIDARNVTYKNGDGHGLVVGWLHDSNAKALDNIWVIQGADLTNLMGHSDNMNACMEKAHYVTAEQAASGEVTYGLNKGVTEAPVWFQTLGEDEVPTLSPDSKIVLVVDGNYMNLGDDPDAIETIETENAQPKTVNVYDLGGRLILNGVDSKTGLRSLPNGLYIIGGRKVVK